MLRCRMETAESCRQSFSLRYYFGFDFADRACSLQPKGVNMRRSAFTLVELLVVIVIIGMLAGLLLPAVTAVRNRANKAAAAIEISQLDFALKSLREKYGMYPPDFADVDREEALRQVKRFIAKAWPRCRRLTRDFQGTELPAQFNAGTALVFWLGGNFDRSQDSVTGRWIIQHVGFSADPTIPLTWMLLATRCQLRPRQETPFDRQAA